MTTLYFQKNEPSIQRQTQKKCQICSKQFNFMRREHQCKRCLRAVCSDCSNEKIVVYKLGFTRRQHRGCKICLEQIKAVMEHIQQNHLQFGKMSHFGNKWMSKIEKRSLTASIDNRKYKKFTREVFDRMWDSYNYSMREFIGVLTYEIDQGSIYNIVNDVFSAVISIAPEEEIEHVAYLVIFVLCFCTPDKAPIVCLFLIQLKSNVANEQGLIQAVLRTLGINEGSQQKMKDFIKIRGKKFLHTFSINSLSAKTTFDIIQKIILKKKIDEIYLYLGLSIEILKQTIQSNKDNLNYCDIMLVRTCTIDAVNNKYKQASSVKSVNFLHKRNEFEEPMNLTVNRAIENSFVKDSPLIASFSEGIRGGRENSKQSFMINNMETQIGESQRSPDPTMFRKREIKEDSFIEDSFSMISMIDEMNQPLERNAKMFQAEGNQILNLMSQVEEKSPNQSLQLKRAPQRNSVKDVSLAFPEDLMFEKGSTSSKGKRPAVCEKCTDANQKINKLMREIELVKLEKSKAEEELKKQNKLLIQKINSKASNTKNNDNYAMEKLEYESQIRKLKQTIQQLELRERDSLALASKIEEYKKLTKKQQQDIRTLQQQLQQSNINIRMLKNKLQSQSFSIPQQKSSSQGSDSQRITEILKQNLREKNQQIEQLSKKNKLILYQLEQFSKQRLNDRQKVQLKQKAIRLQRQKQQILSKMKELSNLLMQEQSQKLFLSEQNFELKEILKGNNITFNRY